MKNKIIFLTFFLFILAPLSGCTNHERSVVLNEEITGLDSPELYISETSVSLSVNTDIYVSIQGEVANPGVYLMPLGSRIFELINHAGGVTESADTSEINMVYLLEDGMQVIIPGIVEEYPYIVSKDLTTTASSESPSGLVNINTATLAELTTLPGIGETRAKAIIDYREKGGHFDSIEDIKNVNGIKNGIYEGLKDSICVK